MGSFHTIRNSNGIPYDMKNLRYGGRFYGFTYVINTGCWIGDGVHLLFLSATGLAMREKVLKKGIICWFMVLEEFRH